MSERAADDTATVADGAAVHTASLDAGGLAFVVALPSDAREAEAPTIDMGVAPGATQLLSAGWEGEGVTLAALCVGGDAALWAPGLEGAVLDAASALARKTLRLPTLTSGPITAGPPFEQRYSGEATSGRHWLGFHDGRAVVCSLSCRGETGRCGALVERASMASEALPPPGPLLRTATSMAAHPRVTAVGLAVVALLVAGLVLWRRPRPAP